MTDHTIINAANTLATWMNSLPRGPDTCLTTLFQGSIEWRVHVLLHGELVVRNHTNGVVAVKTPARWFMRGPRSRFTTFDKVMDEVSKRLKPAPLFLRGNELALLARHGLAYLTKQRLKGN